MPRTLSVKMSPELSLKLAECINTLNERSRVYFATQYPNQEAPTFEAEDNQRYVRVWRRDSSGSRSAYCFVDKTTGDVLKPAGLRAPAKGVRGNLLTASDITNFCGPFGVTYLNRARAANPLYTF